MYHTPSNRCVKYVLKIFHTKIMKNGIVKIVLEEFFWKRALFKEASDPRMLLLLEIGPVYIFH